jgi:hypothetical protein
MSPKFNMMFTTGKGSSILTPDEQLEVAGSIAACKLHETSIDGCKWVEEACAAKRTKKSFGVTSDSVLAKKKKPN